MFDAAKVDEGIFIDRNPEHFNLILDWFRDGPSSRLPSSRLALQQLHAEASFYQIEALMDLLHSQLALLDASGYHDNPGDLGLENLESKFSRAFPALKEILHIAFSKTTSLPDERKLPPASAEIHVRFGNEVGPGDSRIEPTHGKMRLTIVGCLSHSEYNLALAFRPGNDVSQLATRIDGMQRSADRSMCASMLHLIRDLGHIVMHLQRSGGYPAVKCDDFHVCCNDRYGLAREHCTCSFKMRFAG